MSKDPAFLFYSADFLAGTRTMLFDQIGKYITLLCLQHQKGRLSEKDMFNICSTYDCDIWNKFKKDENGFFYNIRLEEESFKRKQYSESRRINRLSKSYVKHMENENENINKDIDPLEKDSKEKPLKRLIKPTLEEIRQYITEQNYTIDPERFFDYYESNGWKVGKNPMKDWKACIRSWQSKDKGRSLAKTYGVGQQTINSMDAFKAFNQEMELKQLGGKK